MMISQTLQDYTEALRRLSSGRPQRVQKGMKITNDLVALEAGRGKGSIKKSRPIFRDLILAIEAAADEQAKFSPDKQRKAQLEKSKQKSQSVRDERDAALQALISRFYEVFELRAEVSRLEAKLLDLEDKLSHALKSKVSPIS